MVVVCAIAPYLPFLPFPLFSDDYIQLALGRQYGPMESWGSLASDVLYRCRATSIVLTYIVDELAGNQALPHRAMNLGFHILGALLVTGLGAWKRIGYRISIPAGAFFALREAHQEAVIWIAALPELLAFVFVVGGLVAWIQWMNSRRPLWGALAVLAFLLGLLSKESAAVLPAFAVLVWWIEARSWRLPLVVVAAMFLITGLYAAAIFAAKSSHLHLNDGTFALQGNVVWTLTHSVLRLLWPWGAISLAVLASFGIGRWRSFVAGGFVWIMIALLPYSFLTYMDRVPSRHTYLASVGIAVFMACAWQALERYAMPDKPVLMAVAVAAILGHNLGYLWTKKFDQYQRRVEPTEQFLRYAEKTTGTVRITCAPYGFEVFRHAAHIRLGWPLNQVLGPDEAADGGVVHDYCDTSKP